MTRTRLGATVIATLIGLSMAASPASAQSTASGAPASCGLPGSVSMTAGRVVELQMSAGSTALTAPTPADFDAGVNATTRPTLTVSARSNHQAGRRPQVEHCFKWIVRLVHDD